jgi:hypothetical protein
MKSHAPLVILALLILSITGCSKHSQKASFSKTNDLGIIDVSSGNPSSHILADGRICTVTPTVLPGGNVSLAITINETNASGVTHSSLVFEAPADRRAYTIGFDKDTVLTMALRN